jgi:RNA polymerase sigma-70 factor (ECF subfamily)
LNEAGGNQFLNGLVLIKLGDINIIIKGCIENKRDSQKKLYELFCPKMLYVCFRYCKNKQEAEDVLQEGFIKVFKSIGTFKFEGSFEGWMRRIMVNTAIEFLRKQKQSRIFDDIEEVYVHPESNYDATSQLSEKELLTMVHSMPMGYRTVFNMYVIEGYSHKEIAEALGISEGTSKSQLAKAKAHLKELLHKYFDVSAYESKQQTITIKQ